MNYKKRIIKMIEEIDNEKILEIIHDFIVVPYNKVSKRNENQKRGS